MTASIRRTPEPTEPSREDRERPDLRRRADVRAAAELAREAVGSRRRGRRRRTSRRRASSRRACRASSIGVSNACTGRFSKTCSLTISSTRSRSSAVSACGWVKSKRSLSGRTAEPAWRTWSPSTSWSALCRRCVAVWFAIVGKRTFQGTTARTRSPAAKPSPRKSSAWSSPKRKRLDELGPRAVPSRSSPGRSPGRRPRGRTATRAAWRGTFPSPRSSSAPICVSASIFS